MKHRSELVQLLVDCIVMSLDNSEFKWDIFFKKWFRENGTPYFFLFKKNLSVTNTQYVELFSLITRHSTYDFASPKECKLLFYSNDHIKTTFTEVVSSLLEDYDNSDTSKITTVRLIVE